MRTMTTETVFKKGKSMFNLVGKVVRRDNSFDLDKTSQSGYHYSRMNIGVDTGNGNTVYCELMGGFSTVKPNVIFVNDKADFKNRFEIDFDDRNDETIIENVNDMCFLKVGLEKDIAGKTVERKFLSEYDAIEYIHDKLEDGMIVNIKGDIDYNFYEGSVNVQKKIRSIFLSKAEESKYRATFTQSILINEDSVGKLDKEAKAFPIDCYVTNYIGKVGDKVVKKTLPLFKPMELEYKVDNPDSTKKLLERFFKVEKGLTEIVVEGNLIEGQQTVAVSEDDIPDDIKDLIDCGVWSKEDVLNKMAVGGERVRRMVITKPYIQMKGEGENKLPQLSVEKEKYTQEQIVEAMRLYNDDSDDTDNPFVNDEEAPKQEEAAEGDGWLNDFI